MRKLYDNKQNARLALLRFALYKWYQKELRLRTDAFNFIKRVAELFNTNFRMNLMSIINQLNKNKLCQKKANKFLEKMKDYYKFRTIHLMCQSSVKNNKFKKLLYQIEKHHTKDSISTYFGKWRSYSCREKASHEEVNI